MVRNAEEPEGHVDPAWVCNDIVGAVGVSGAPGGDKDEACAKAGIDKVAADLK
jgi:uncharacterized protein GlcG (DUF336 family)